VDPLTLTFVLSLFNPYINITSQKFSLTPFHLLFIILYSWPPCGLIPVLPDYLLLRHSCTWDKTSIFWYCHCQQWKKRKRRECAAGQEKKIWKEGEISRLAHFNVWASWEVCYWKRKGFWFNHKIMIKVQESPPNIMVPRKPMVYESLSKGLVVQGKDASPPVHPT